MIRRHRIRTPGGLASSACVLLLLAAACEQPASGPAAPDIRFAPGGNGGGSSIDVTGVDPNEVEQGASGVSLRILGSGFAQGASVTFELNGQTTADITATSATVVSDTEILASIDVAIDAETVNYDVAVRKGPSKGVGSELLTVKPGQGPPAPETPLSVTFDQTVSGPAGGAVVGDVDGDGDGTSDAYVDGVDDVLAILRSNGNLNVDMPDGKRNQPPARTVDIQIHSPETGLSDRGAQAIFINTSDLCPDNPASICGPGEIDVAIRDMPVSATAVAQTVLAFIWVEGNTEHRLKYGLGCESSVAPRFPSERAFVMHPDPDTWVVWGTDATWCTRSTKGNASFVTVSEDARADFSFTLTRLP